MGRVTEDAPGAVWLNLMPTGTASTEADAAVAQAARARARIRVAMVERLVRSRMVGSRVVVRRRRAGRG